MNWIIIVGLGNPGKKYLNTKHNIGFAVLDNVAKALNETWKEFKKAGQVIVLKTNLKNVVLFKPSSYMNDSGMPLIEVMDFFDIETQSLFLIHDEKGLPLATIKYSDSIGANGHKGVGSVIHMMQSKEFMRGRFGIGLPFKNRNLEQYVLSPFPNQAKQKIKKSLITMTKDICEYIEHQDFVKLQNKRNRSLGSIGVNK